MLYSALAHMFIKSVKDTYLNAMDGTTLNLAELDMTHPTAGGRRVCQKTNWSILCALRDCHLLYFGP